jgi:predicted Zn-dependent peptidase
MTEITTRVLNPAITLHHTRDTRFKSARLSLVWVHPAHPDTSPLTTLLFGILRRGSEHYPSLALLNRRLDELYGATLTIRNYLHGDSHVVVYTAEMTEQAFLPPADTCLDILGGVMELLADMILRPLREADGRLRVDAVEKEKQSLCDSLRSLCNDTRAYAGNRLREIMCKGEPYGISIGGTVEQVKTVTAAQVTEHHKNLLSSARLEVFYTGRAAADGVAAAFDKAFAGWSPHTPCSALTAVHLPPKALRSVSEDMEVSQGKLCMAWSCGESFETLRGDPDALAAYAVCNELFGVMQSSRLFRHVREERGLCYFCDSALDMTKGILWVSCGISPESRAEAEAAIRAELTAIQEGRITPEEVELAKLSLQNAYRQMGDSQSSLEVFALGCLLNGTPDTPEEERDRISRVTPTDVVRVAGRFQPDTVFFLNGTSDGASEDEEDYDD